MQNKIKLNFQDDYYYFYDWLKDDEIKEYSNIEFIKIDSSDLNTLMNYEVMMDNVLDNKIYLYSDTFSFIAIKYKEGISKKVSSVRLEDEYRLKKIIEGLKYSTLNYKKIKKKVRIMELRYMNNIKKALLEEISSLEASDEDKMRYLYYEWFDKKENNLETIRQKMITRLQKPLTKKEKYIYELLLASKN